MPYFKGIGNKTEISVRGQDRLIISTPNQRNEKATQNMSSPEATSGPTGGYKDYTKQFSDVTVLFYNIMFPRQCHQNIYLK